MTKRAGSSPWTAAFFAVFRRADLAFESGGAWLIGRRRRYLDFTLAWRSTHWAIPPHLVAAFRSKRKALHMSNLFKSPDGDAGGALCEQSFADFVFSVIGWEAMECAIKVTLTTFLRGQAGAYPHRSFEVIPWPGPWARCRDRSRQYLEAMARRWKVLTRCRSANSTPSEVSSVPIPRHPDRTALQARAGGARRRTRSSRTSSALRRQRLLLVSTKVQTGMAHRRTVRL